MAERDPELDAIMSGMIDHRNRSTRRFDWFAMDNAIDALRKHPYFKAKTSAALKELTDLGQEFDTGGGVVRRDEE